MAGGGVRAQGRQNTSIITCIFVVPCARSPENPPLSAVGAAVHTFPRTRHRLEYLLPNSLPAPAGEAVVDGLVRAALCAQSRHRQQPHAGQGWFAGKCGTVFVDRSMLNQNKFAAMDLASKLGDQARQSKHG